MRVLLDECVPKKLKQELVEHDVKTVPEMRWSGVKNGALLQNAAASFDVLITVDRRMERERDISSLDLALLVLVAPRTEIDILRPLMPKARLALRDIRIGEVRYIAGASPSSDSS